jgi:hypothetical protein
MNFDTNTLKTRKPLWVALSDLFLDTELQDYDCLFIANKMQESGYTLDEVEDILMLEVFPVCIANLHSVAGEWAGFNEDWLAEKITHSKPPNLIQRWLHRRRFRMIKDDWRKIVEKYNDLN